MNNATNSYLRNFPTDPDRRCGYVFFDRHHGASQGLFAAGNMSYGVGDQPETVAANRDKVRQSMGAAVILSARQNHGEWIHVQTSPLAADLEVPDCDALITNQSDIALIIQHADCQAILLYDRRQKVIAAVHSGWRGSVANLLAKTVQRLQIEFGTLPGDIQAVISPSLGPCCAEFVNYTEELPADFTRFMVRPNYFDFWQISLMQLQQCGLVTELVQLPTVCTSCSADFFSYRRACRESGGITGRNCAAICLFS